MILDSPHPQQPQPEASEEHLTQVSHDNRIGALLDSARISLNTCLYLIEQERRIVTAEPSDLEKMIDQSLGWADVARNYVVEHMQAPPTSIHIVSK